MDNIEVELENRLDDLLRILVGKRQNNVSAVISEDNQYVHAISVEDVLIKLKCSIEDLRELLEILKSDNLITYITYEENNLTEIKEAKIKLNGKIFIGNKGYKRKREIKDAANIRLDKLTSYQTKLSSRLSFATWMLAVGTLALVIVELIKWYYECPCH